MQKKPSHQINIRVSKTLLGAVSRYAKKELGTRNTSAAIRFVLAEALANAGFLKRSELAIARNGGGRDNV